MAADNTKVKATGIDYDKVRAAAGNTNEALGKTSSTSGVSTSRDNLMNYAPGGMYAGSGKSYSGESSNPLGSYDASGLIDSQAKSALAAKVAALQKARDTDTAMYNQQADALPGQYQPLRNQADLRGAQDSRAITETMAAQGNWRSGANQTAQTANAASTANNISSLNTQQQGQLDKLKQAIAQVQAGYNSDIVSATADTEAQKYAAKISQLNTDRQFDQQNRQFDKSFGLQEAGLSGMYNGQQTMQGKQSDASIASSNASTAINVAQLKEMQDPNSMTNQMAKIGLETSKLNYAALPDQLKAQAQQIAQSLQQGQLSIQQAQIQLDYLPRQMELGLAQTQASINASNRSNTTPKSITQSSNEGKGNQDDAIIEARRQIENGVSPGNVANSIEQQRTSLKRQGVNVDALIKSVWQMSGVQTKPEAEDSWR